ncbi:hypothetical protein PMAN_a1239 [Pseudoalteromonas marina]|nr:hypothetical protein PMAN_a1239 [Pseudoalteromonas marina]
MVKALLKKCAVISAQKVKSRCYCEQLTRQTKAEYNFITQLALNMV